MIDTAAKPANPLPQVTLAEFFAEMGRGSQAKMARGLKVSRAMISQVASDPDVCASYALAKRIKGYMECRGFTVDIETLIRTEPAKAAKSSKAQS